MKTWCIIFERELEGKDVIHVKQENEPAETEVIKYILDRGYNFDIKYDEIKRVYEIK